MVMKTSTSQYTTNKASFCRIQFDSILGGFPSNSPRSKTFWVPSKKTMKIKRFGWTCSCSQAERLASPNSLAGQSEGGYDTHHMGLTFQLVRDLGRHFQQEQGPWVDHVETEAFCAEVQRQASPVGLEEVWEVGCVLQEMSGGVEVLGVQ